MKKINWTQQQEQAIKHRGSDVLVTASAGTGKTAVLSGRCVDILRDKKSCSNVWNMLVLTFTDAAAEQMRNKIAEQLQAAYMVTKDTHLREQLILLQGTDISTIHSFCKRLITEYFYKLEIDPTFGIIDADEQRLLKAEILGQTIEWAWEQGIPADELKELLYGRNIGNKEDFLNNIIDISDFLETIVRKNNWYEQIKQIASEDDFGNSVYAAKQRELISKQLNEVINTIHSCISLYHKITGNNDWNEKLINTHIKPLEGLSAFLKENKWDSFVSTMAEFKKPKTFGPKDIDKNMAELLRTTVKEAIEDVINLNEFAILQPDYSNNTAATASRQTIVLIELVKKFEQLYSQAKQKINRMDFADLERYTLRLLSNEASSFEGLVPSDTAIMLRNRYKYIFVDEYQDINPVQKAILDLLSNKGCVFVVGDIKQSIYAFRGAQPEIFAKDLENTKDNKGNNCVRVALNNNFRSSQEILDFVNIIFAKIMRRNIARIDYDESAKLTRTFQQDHKLANINRPRVELHILDDNIEEDTDEEQYNTTINEQDGSNTTSARQRQAVMIARRIKQMVGEDTKQTEFEIYDSETDCTRPVEYRDIVILMRSVAKRVNDYVEILQLAGVPVSCEAAAGYFEATEIRDFLCLLKVLDNPLRDIELAAVLRGPIFKISDTELLKIRLYAKNDEKQKYLYDCIVTYCQTGIEQILADKLKRVVNTINKWRETAKHQILSDLIWRIYSETNLPSFYSAMVNGKNRKANLLKLHERAIQFEGFANNTGGISLGRFISFIEKLQESNTEWSNAEPEDASSNVVRIMSVHKSKGLEFPVVFLTELDSPFNKSDERQQVLFNNDNGLGLTIIDKNTNIKSNSAAYQIIAEQKRRENLAEEMRILYVAMTRAKEKLIITGSNNRNKCSEILSKASLFNEELLAVRQLSNCRNMMAWILFGLSGHKKLHTTFETGLEASSECDELFELNLYGCDELNRLAENIKELRRKKITAHTKRKASKKLDLLEVVQKNLNQKYNYNYATTLPSKQSVTALAHKDDEFAIIDYSKALPQIPTVLLGEKTKLTKETEGRIIGTATHAVIAEINLSEPINIKSIEQVIKKLITRGIISGETAKCVDIEAIQAFFNSEPGQQALDNKNSVKREWPFTYAMKMDNNENMVVQGVIDMLIKTQDGLIVIDFKTDRINSEQSKQRTDIYRGQLDLYAKAAQAILKCKICGKWLYFLSPRCAISI